MITPRVSILMPVYNCAPFVVRAVESIRRQSFGDWELLIVDDGSTDETLKCLKTISDRRVVVIDGRTNVGLAQRLNELIDRAQGSVFARMDGDDIAHPDRLTRQLHFLDNNPDVDVVACGMVVIDGVNAVVGVNRPRHQLHDDIVKRPWTGFHMNHATWVGRADWFRRFRYEARALRTEDDELLLRAYQTSRFARLPDILYAYRVEELAFRRILFARIQHSRWLVHHAMRQRDPRLLLGLPIHAAKAVVDATATGSGLGLRLLRHRAEAIPNRLRVFWNRLLRDYQFETGLFGRN